MLLIEMCFTKLINFSGFMRVLLLITFVQVEFDDNGK